MNLIRMTAIITWVVATFCLGLFSGAVLGNKYEHLHNMV